MLCKIIMGKADIKQGLDLAVEKQPVPLLRSEIQEWQESPVIDGLFTSVSKFPLMYPGMCRISDISSHQVATVEYCLWIWDTETFSRVDKWFHSKSHWSTSSSGCQSNSPVFKFCQILEIFSYNIKSGGN